MAQEKTEDSGEQCRPAKRNAPNLTARRGNTVDQGFRGYEDVAKHVCCSHEHEHWQAGPVRRQDTSPASAPR